MSNSTAVVRKEVKLKRGVFHPPLSSGRLEGEYFQDPTRWAPSINYNLTLEQVRNQMTPAELYKLDMKLHDKTAKLIMETERRWSENFELSTSRALDIQRVYRGHVGRNALLARIEDLKLIKDQREARQDAMELVHSGKSREAVTRLESMLGVTEDLLIMKAKILYTIAEHEKCAKAAQKVIEISPDNYDAHYILASSYVSREMLVPLIIRISLVFSRFTENKHLLQYLLRKTEAFDELKNTINLLGPRLDACKLRGYLCAKLDPPKYDLAVLDFDFIVQEDPSDLNIYLHRACAQVGQQNWEAVIADLTIVLTYQPKLTSVMLLRARAYCCRRDWENAKADYIKVLRLSPDDAEALAGLELITTPPEDLPFLSTEFSF